MKIDRTGIERLVPHAGAMCLLDEVTAWEQDWIVCASAAPAATHPLARAGRVPAIAAAEYAAQATAVHGALIDTTGAPRTGLLATLVDVTLAAPELPVGQALRIRADLLGRSPAGCMYEFEVSAGAGVIVTGRLTVALLAEAPA